MNFEMTERLTTVEPPKILHENEAWKEEGAVRTMTCSTALPIGFARGRGLRCTTGSLSSASRKAGIPKSKSSDGAPDGPATGE